MSDFSEYSVDPFELSGNIPEDRAAFYELAKNRIQYQSREDNRSWLSRVLNRIDQETTATFIVGFDNKVDESGDMRKFVNSLQIVVNTGILDEFSQQYGEDASDLVPFLVEHEIFEAWVAVKHGVGGGMGVDGRHMLARRREVYLAVQQGLGEKWLAYQMYINPGKEEEYLSALAYAKRRLNGS